MEKDQNIVDFENQVFDDLDVNPYEIVIAVSKMARDINDKARKYIPPDQDVNPVEIALNRLSRQTVFKYNSEVEEDSAEET